MPEYPAPLQSRLTRSERRRRLMEELLGQSLQPQQTQMVSGRAVPQSPLQGIMKVAQAYLAKKGMDQADTEQEKIAQEYAQGRERDMGTVTNLLTGREQTGGPLRNVDQYQQFQPAVEPDYLKAAITAGSSPYVQGTGMEKVAQAMLSSRSQPRGEYNIIRDVTVDGKTIPVIFNTRTRETFNMDGTPFIGGAPEGGPTSPQYDPTVQRTVAGAKKSGQVEGEAVTTAQIDLPKIESDAEYLKGIVRQAVDHPGMSGAVGTWSPGKVASFVPGTKESDFMQIQKQITGKQFMQAYQTLKGGGQITEIEGQKATEALSRMSTASSEKAYREAANDFISEIDRLTKIAEERAGKKQSSQPAEPKVLKFDAQGNLIQ